MGKAKFQNLLLVLGIVLVLVGVPYLIYYLGSFITIDYFGYINNWWVVLVFIILVFAIYILAGINLEKKMGSLFLTLFVGSMFILGMQLGSKPKVDMAQYALLVEKEEKIETLDATLAQLEQDLIQLIDQSLEAQALENADFKNHEIIFFPPGNSVLSDYNKAKITAFLASIKNCKLNINGYTDASGDKAFNMNISKERAQHVADFIQATDQNKNTIVNITGYGDSHQLAENNNELSSSKNRRVTIEIIGKTDSAEKNRIESELNTTRAEIAELKAEKDSLRVLVFEGGN